MDYVSYLGKRLLQMVPVLFGVTLAVFFMVHLIPGDPITILLGPRASPENVARLTAALGLDRPLWTQYLLFLQNLLRGDLGDSIIRRMPVLTLIIERLGATFFLLGYAMVMALLITVPASILAALRRNRLPDHAVRTFSLVGFVMPPFWVGLILMLLLSIKWKLVPLSGYGTGFIGHLRHLFSPALTIALSLAAILIRSLRAKIISVMQADFVDTARAKGVPERRVMIAHVLRNSLISTVTILGVNVGWLLGGTVVVESVFSVPGLGQLLIQSIFSRDYPVVQGLTLFLAFMVMVINLTTDLVYTLLDPRVDYEQ